MLYTVLNRFIFFVFILAPTLTLFPCNAKGNALLKAHALLEERRFEEILDCLSKPFNEAELEQRRQILCGFAYVWMENWDKACETFNEVFQSSELSNSNIRVSYPSFLKKEGEFFDCFRASRFSEEDMRYMGRVLWMDRIASRLVRNRTAPMERILSLLDFVYRHVRFGMEGKPYYTDHPLSALIRGSGMCEELAWILTQLLHAADIENFRLLLYDVSQSTESVHSIALCLCEEQWIPLDPSYGYVLLDATGDPPIPFPANFLVNPTKASIRAFGSTVKPVQTYIDSIRRFGVYQENADSLRETHPSHDLEWESFTPRFILLSQLIEPVHHLGALGQPPRAVAIPQTEPGRNRIVSWKYTSLPYLFRLTHKTNPARRAMYERVYGYLNPIRRGRRALLLGAYEEAETELREALSSSELSMEAREDAEYYLAVTAFERENFSQARERFTGFLDSYKESGWTERVFYQLAQIAEKNGDSSARDRYLEKCSQNHGGSLFQWRRKLGI